MRKLLFILLAVIALTGCGNNRNNGKTSSAEDMVENGKIGYADIVSFLVQGFHCRWEGMSPEERGLSPVYSYNSPYAGYTIKDIDGNGIDELLIGDMFENGDYFLYDIYTINPKDGTIIHLADGGERDRFKINGNGVIIEEGSNSAFDSFQKGYSIVDGQLVGINGWNDSLLSLNLESFAGMAEQNNLDGTFGE